MDKETPVIMIQHRKPRRIGLPPVLTRWTTSVLRPIAAIAMMMKNLESSLNGRNSAASAPREVHRVVRMLASRKKRTKNGKTFFKEKEAEE